MIRFGTRFTETLWPAVSCVAVTAGFILCTPETALARGQETESGETATAPEVPPRHPAQQLPSGHPRVGSPQSESSALPPIPADSGTGAAALRWEIPKSWIAEAPSSSMRRAQYRIPGAGGEAGEAQCVVYYFGPGQGGGARANAERWADQFGQPDGRPSREIMKTEELDIGGIPVLFVEVAGIYSGGIAAMGGPGKALSDHMLLGAIAEGPDANWFFKLTGPLATVAGHRTAFRDLLESLKKGV